MFELIKIKNNNLDKFKSHLISSKKNNSLRNKDNQKKLTPFEELLYEVLPPQKEPELFELWKELPNAETNLIQNPTEENLEKYAFIVKNIARKIIEKNFIIETFKRKTRTGKEVMLTTVKIIDEKLHKMMLAINSKKNTAFEILRNLKDIRGILLDLKQ